MWGASVTLKIQFFFAVVQLARERRARSPVPFAFGWFWHARCDSHPLPLDEMVRNFVALYAGVHFSGRDVGGLIVGLGFLRAPPPRRASPHLQAL